MRTRIVDETANRGGRVQIGDKVRIKYSYNGDVSFYVVTELDNGVGLVNISWGEVDLFFKDLDKLNQQLKKMDYKIVDVEMTVTNKEDKNED